MDIAKRLITHAKSSGCDAVKFQKRNIDVVYTQEFLNQERQSPWGTTQRAQKEALEFGIDQYDVINQFCNELSIDWFASSWDIDSQKLMRKFWLQNK